MSGMLGQIIGNVLGGGGGQSSQSSAAIADILRQVIAGRGGQAGTGGGFSDLLQKLQQAGLGPQLQSWIGTGQNQPVSPAQIGSAFTPEQIDAWARQAGTTPEAMRQVLAEALPHAVDQVTPGGQVPSQTADIGGLLGSLLGGLGGVRRA